MRNLLGLDIGSDTIKLVQLDQKGSKPKLSIAAIVKNPAAGHISSNEKETLTLVESLKQLKKESGVSNNLVSLSLPERNIFIQTLELPRMNTKELEQAINWEAESVIPKPISEVTFDWQLIEDEKARKENKVKVVIVAAPLTLVADYSSVLKQAGFEPLSFESESMALIRSTSILTGKKNLIIFNWGMKSADIILVKNGDFYLNRSLATTGEALTRAISMGLGLDIASAEEYKKTYGLSTELEGKVGKTLQPILEALTNEIKKAVNFFEEKEQVKPEMMILAGGSSLLYGAGEYFTQAVGLEVQIANPLHGIELSSGQKEALSKQASIYSVVTGLAMKQF